MDTQWQHWNAGDYARNSSAQRLWAEELLAKLSLAGDEGLLDLGCGVGKISAALAGCVPRGRVLGVDASAAMVDFARQSFPPDLNPNLAFRQMDATNLDTGELFDAVFSNTVLHWIKDQRSVLLGVRRSLRPGGHLLFQMGEEGCAAGMLEVVGRVIQAPAWKDYFSGFEVPYHFGRKDDFQALLPVCGFQPLRVELFAKEMRHQGPDGLKGWLRTTWFPYTDRLPADLRNAFLDETVGTYLLAAHPEDESGQTHVAMVRLEVEALAR